MTHTRNVSGRPRHFNADNVLWATTRVFWRLGYRATTIQHLVDATKVERGSLYRTFGNKQALFKQAVEHYSNYQVARLPVGAGPATILRAWFANNLEDASHKDLPSGCLVINSVVELPALPQTLQELVRGHLDGLRQFFRQFVELGVARQEFLPVDPEIKAESLLAAIVGINVLSRSGSSLAELTRIADSALEFTHAT